MNIDLAYYCNIGKQAVNEDAVNVLAAGGNLLALAADGVSGHGGGAQASSCVISALANRLSQSEFSEDAVNAAINEANSRVLAMQNDQVQMRSTAAVCWITKNRAIAAHIGDTRIYQIRKGEIIYQSADHTAAQVSAMAGMIAADEIRSSPSANYLLRAIGDTEPVKADCKILTVEPDDLFLICTHGFWKQIPELQMLGCLWNAETMTDWLRAMRKRIESSAGDSLDNHSAIVIRVQP